jgi:hypothetical protein
MSTLWSKVHADFGPDSDGLVISHAMNRLQNQCRALFLQITSTQGGTPLEEVINSAFVTLSRSLGYGCQKSEDKRSGEYVHSKGVYVPKHPLCVPKLQLVSK